MVSEKQGDVNSFIFYGTVILSILFISKIPLVQFFKRLLLVLPFLLAAALFFPLSVLIGGESISEMSLERSLYVALSIFLKALCSFSLLLVLILTEKINHLIAALQKIGMPRFMGFVIAIMFRYIFLLAGEAHKIETAQKSRAPNIMKKHRLKVYSSQMALIFLRSWERSKKVYNAMLSRGFDGSFKTIKHFRIKPHELIFSFIFLAIFALIRFMEPVLQLFN